MNKCTKCKLNKPLVQFRIYNTSGKRRNVCRSCEAKQAKERRLVITPQQRYVFEYLRRCKCVHCGERNPICLDFHHIRPANKTADVSYMVKRKVPIQDIKKEIDKCVVLCANCHRIETARLTKQYRYRMLYDSNSYKQQETYNYAYYAATSSLSGESV